MARKRTLKRIITGFFVLGAVLLLLANALLAWVMTGPRSLEMLTPYIEEALTPEGSAYRAAIGDTQLVWDGWQQPLSLHVRDVAVRDAKGDRVAAFPDIAVRIRLMRLLLGRIDVKSVEIIKPYAVLNQAADGTLSLGFTDGSSTGAAVPLDLSLLTAREDERNPISRLRLIEVKHARLQLRNEANGIFLESADASLEIKRNGQVVSGVLAMPLSFGDKAGELDISFALDGTAKVMSAQSVFFGIPSPLIAQLLPAHGWLKAADITLSGQVKTEADFDLNVSHVQFAVSGAQGTVSLPEQFEEPIAIRRLELEGGLSDAFNRIEVSKGVLEFGEKIAANFTANIHHEAGDFAVDADAELFDAPIDGLRLYWPKSLAPNTRKWVTERISRGTIPKAQVVARFKHGELKMKNTPTETVSADIEVKGADVLYMPSHPPVKNVNGVVHFTGSSMEAKGATGSFMDATKLESVHIRFPDLNAADVPLEVAMDVATNAKEVQRFLSLPPISKDKKLNITPDITGTASGHVELGMIAFSEHEPADGIPEIDYKVKANLEGVNQKQFLHKYDVENAAMQVALDNHGIHAEGKATVNGQAAELNVHETFGKSADSVYYVKMLMPVEKMKQFGLPVIPFIKGSMGLDAHVVLAENKEEVSATLDVKDIEVALPEHGFVKKPGEKATLKLKTERLPSGNTALREFELSGPLGAAKGKGEFAKGSGDVVSLHFAPVKLAGHALNKLEYDSTKEGFALVARGDRFNLSPYMERKQNSDDQGGMKIDLQAERIVFGEGRELKKVNALVDCGRICRSAKVQAQTADGGAVDYAIKGGVVSASSVNAGELLRVLGIYDNVEGGTLKLTGKYEGSKIVGKLVMNDYMLTKAPVLTKILTVASFTGLLDTIGGKGIAFDKLSAPYEYERGFILLKDAKQYGSALGFSATGSISMPDSSLDISGTLAPSYTVNSLVGRIPLLGDIITGGKGEGLIAINYSVKGPMSDPSVGVNPLTVLTPGFLRGIFDIFDKPAPDIKELQKRSKQRSERKEQGIETISPAAGRPDMVRR